MTKTNDTLSNLIYSAKSVFQPRSENDLKSFENYIYDNYISDLEGDGESIPTPTVENDKRAKRRSIFELPWKQHEDTYAVEFHCAASRE